MKLNLHMRSLHANLAAFLFLTIFAGVCPMTIGAVPAEEEDMNVAVHEEMSHGGTMAKDQEEESIPCEQCDDHAGGPVKLLLSVGTMEKFAPVVPLAVLSAELPWFMKGSVMAQQAAIGSSPPEIALLQTIVLRI